MHMHHPTTIILLALAPVVTLAQNATIPLSIPLNFNCSTFSAPSGRQSILKYTQLSNTTLRVSRADICPSDADAERQRSCRVVAGGTVNVTATTNATDIPDARVLHTMLRQALKLGGASSRLLDDFPASVSELGFNQTGMSMPIRPGTAGYIGFTPNMTCYEGVVSTNSSCSTSDEGTRNVKDNFEGRALQICVPRTFNEGPRKRLRTRVLGKVEVVEVSVEEANREEMKINPADNDSRPENHYNPGPPTEKPGVVVGEGGSVEIQWASLSTAVVLAVGMVGWM
jgi:hypothetical protein